MFNGVLQMSNVFSNNEILETKMNIQGNNRRLLKTCLVVVTRAVASKNFPMGEVQNLRPSP